MPLGTGVFTTMDSNVYSLESFCLSNVGMVSCLTYIYCTYWKIGNFGHGLLDAKALRSSES